MCQGFGGKPGLGPYVAKSDLSRTNTLDQNGFHSIVVPYSLKILPMQTFKVLSKANYGMHIVFALLHGQYW